MLRADDVEGKKLDWVRTAVHDICQPITALECVLFLATMSAEGQCPPTAGELMETIRLALEQCGRLSERVRAMQEKLQAEI